MANSSLLPKTAASFAAKSYWDEFFRKRESAFEWYGELRHLAPTLERYLKPSDRVLHVGCGNSNLPEQLHDSGFRNITNIDTASEVIAKKAAKNAKSRPQLDWLCRDATKSEFPDESFSVILDKGTLDAIFPSEDVSDAALPELVSGLFSEMGRVLSSSMGRYVTITLAQPHVLRGWLHFFAQKGGFLLRVHQVVAPEGEEMEFKLPVFALVATKLKPGAHMPQVLEYVVGEAKKPERYPDLLGLCQRVEAAQEFAQFAHRCRTGHFGAAGASISLCGSSGAPRYSITVLDNPGNHSGGYGVFIIPQGREVEWLFGSEAGRVELCRKSSKSRLAVVTLCRGQTFARGLDEVKAELAPYARAFAPADTNSSIPYLTIGEDVVGWRQTIAKGHSRLSGDYVVEDVRVSDSFYRRLIFLDSPDTCQTEVSILSRSINGPASAAVVAVGELESDYRRSLLSALALAGATDAQAPLVCSSGKRMRILILGVGGGSLSMFIRSWFPEARITAVEIDSDVLAVARQWFGLVEDRQLDVVEGDALDFLNTAAANIENKKSDDLFNVVLMDIAGSVEVGGLKAPLPQFVTPEALGWIRTILRPDGCLGMNVMSRDPARLAAVSAAVDGVFAHSSSVSSDADLNRVLLCLPFAPPPNVDLHARIARLGAFLRPKEEVTEEATPTAPSEGGKKKRKRRGKAKAAKSDVAGDLGELKLS